MTIVTESTVTVDAENEWTDWVQLVPGEKRALSISGVTDSKVTLQRRLDGTNARDVGYWYADDEPDYEANARQEIRLGVATGDYGTDTPQLEIRE